VTSVVRDRPLLVAETFGPTLQGEGPSCGQQALFVRLSRCNLSCPSCDTPYTWNWQRFDIMAETHRLTAPDILDWALGYPTELLVITGGEPLLQQDLLVPLVAALTAAGRRVEMETNGTIAPAAALVEAVTRFNVSPKLASFAAPGDAQRRINPGALRALVATGRAVFKFVVSSVTDLDEIAELQRRFDLRPVWVMPEGTTTERLLEVMRALADEVVGRGWHLSTRLHVMLWGDARGR
jgi:organic radical activating enzyme